ncbi:MAG TPA: FAD-binding oxidoreductase [Chitinophagaceae bacterium]|nr:FAD-binding oxidoreductase [Chitinophagaceae bacterium]
MHADFLIIGQGISGSFLSWYLQRAGASCIIIDDHKHNTASRVAAGLINPVTGRRLVRSWMTDELMPFAWNAYTTVGKELGVDCIREASLLQFFNAPDMQDAFNKKLLEEPAFITPPDGHEWRQYFNYPFGLGTIAPCYIANINALLIAYRKQLLAQGQLLSQKFEVSQLQCDAEGVQYRDIRASKIIFCDGDAGAGNPWFHRLPYALNKGEALLLRIPGLPVEHIYKFRYTLIPLDAADCLFWFGSSYEWIYDNELPSEAFRTDAEAALNKILRIPYTVVDHHAAIRPANIERRPFVGLHPRHPQIGILNGMGTKGCSLAPYFAHQLATHLVNGGPLLPAADVQRFERVLSLS